MAAILEGEQLFVGAVESTYATDATPTAALNALRVKTNINPAKVDFEDKDYDSGMMGAKGKLEKRRWVEGDIEAYLAGSGTANVVSALSPLLRAAGFKVSTDADKVDITLDELSNTASITGKFWRSTVSQTLLGARMDWVIELSEDALPRFNFPSFKALYSKQVNGAKPTGIDLSAFLNPKPTSQVNFVTQNVLGYAATIAKVSIKGNNEVVYVPASGTIEIVSRKVTIDIELKEPTPDMKDFFDSIGNYGAIDLQHGQNTVDEGHIFEFHMPNAQLHDVTKTTRNKIGYLNCSFECIPTEPNNEFTMVSR